MKMIRATGPTVFLAKSKILLRSKTKAPQDKTICKPIHPALLGLICEAN